MAACPFVEHGDGGVAGRVRRLCAPDCAGRVAGRRADFLIAVRHLQIEILERRLEGPVGELGEREIAETHRGWAGGRGDRRRVKLV